MSARAALAGDGAMDAIEVAAVNDVSARKAQEILDSLTADRLLQILPGEEAAPRYGFVEEGLPTLIWMTWAQRNLTREPTRPKAAIA